MEFVCSTRYSQKTLTAMARALRKTVRARTNLWLKVVCAVLIGICLLSIYASWDDPWYVGTNGVVIVFLLAVQWKQDWLNGYIARRRALPCPRAGRFTPAPQPRRGRPAWRTRPR